MDTRPFCEYVGIYELLHMYGEENPSMVLGSERSKLKYKGNGNVWNIKCGIWKCME